MLKKVLLIGFAILLVAVGFALGATFMRLPSVVPPLSPATLSDAIIGTRCDGDYGSIHPGYQCYYYDVPNTQQRERRGVWIIPDTLAFNLSSLELPLSGSWKTYRSSGAGLSFRYPEEWSVSTETEQGVLRVMMGKASDMPPGMMIEIVPKNAISVEQRITEELTGEGRSFRNTLTLNGAEAVQIVHRALQSIGEDFISLYFDRREDYVHVSAPIYLNPFYDYPTNVLLRSFTVLSK